MYSPRVHNQPPENKKAIIRGDDGLVSCSTNARLHHPVRSRGCVVVVV
jgi:hypothetical protein